MRGVFVNEFRMLLEFQRSGLAPLFHEALGLLREHDVVERFVKEGGYRIDPPVDFSPTDGAEISSAAQTLVASHLGMLRLRCATSATSLIIFADNGARLIAIRAGRKAADVMGGPSIKGVTLLEALRAAGDWSRHHYDWVTKGTSSWPIQKLTELGLDIKDPVLPARILDCYGFETYVAFEQALLNAIRVLAHSWWGGADEGYITAPVSYWKGVMGGTEDLVEDVRQANALQEATAQLQRKSENEYTVEDWIIHALTAYSAGDSTRAIDRLKKALRVRGITPEEQVYVRFNQAVVLDKLGDFKKAIKLYDEITNLTKGQTNPRMLTIMADAMFNKAVDLGRRRNFDSEIKLYDDLIARFQTFAEKNLQQAVARSFLNKGITLIKKDLVSESVAIFDELISRFRASDDLKLREQVAKAFTSKAGVLQHLGHNDEARSTYREFLAYAGEDPDPNIREKISEVKQALSQAAARESVEQDSN